MEKKTMMDNIQLPSTVNKDIVQSYRFTMSRCKLTVPERRIMIRITELAQCEIKGLKLKDHKCQIVPNELLQLKEVTLPLSSIFPDSNTLGGRDYEDVKKAFKSLAKKGLEYETKNFWQYTEIITKPKIYKHGGEWFANFNVYDEIWYCLLDFSKGYRKFEMLTAMSFNSIFSMQIYELISGQTEPYDLMKDTIIKMFKLSKTMSSGQHIEEKVLNMAKKDLDEKAPYGFNYKRIEVKSRGRGGKKTIGWRLLPYYIPKNRNNALEIKDIAAKLPSGGRFGGLLKTETYNLLVKEFGWPKDSVNSNKALFMRAEKELPDLIDTLRRLYGSARTANNPIAYVIHCLQEELTHTTQHK